MICTRRCLAIISPIFITCVCTYVHACCMYICHDKLSTSVLYRTDVSFIMYIYNLYILSFDSMLCCLVFGSCREEDTDHQGEETVEEKTKGELPHH